LSGFGFGLGTVIYKWSVLPNLIPTHFGVSGLADDWSSKRWLLALPAISFVLYAILTWLGRYPHKFNYLWQITERNAQRQYYLATSVVDILKAELMAVWLDHLANDSRRTRPSNRTRHRVRAHYLDRRRWYRDWLFVRCVSGTPGVTDEN